jgi:hypothetical protein
VLSEGAWTNLSVGYSLVAFGRYHADVTARNPNPEESDYKFAAGPFDGTGGSYGRNLGGLLTAIGGSQMGTLEARVKEVSHGFTDPGVALTRAVAVPLSYDKVTLEMRSLAAEINRAGIRYDILRANSNAAAFSLFGRLGVRVTPPVPVPGYQTRVP